MKTAHLTILTLLFLSSYSGLTAQREGLSDNDSITQYIISIKNQNTITEAPLLVINGFAIEYSDYLDKYPPLSRSDIKQIDYLAGNSETSMNIYGDRAKGGVLLIMTNNFQEKSTKTIDDSKVLYMMENKQLSREELERLNPEDIESIEVIKEDKEIRKITKGKYEGVVIITLKKDKKNK